MLILNIVYNCMNYAQITIIGNENTHSHPIVMDKSLLQINIAAFWETVLKKQLMLGLD